MAVSGDYRLVDVWHVVVEVLDFCAVVHGQAVAVGVGNVDNGGTRLDDSLHNTRKVLIVSASRVFSVKLNVVDVFAGVLHGVDGTLDDFLAVRIELVFDVRIRRADAGVDAAAFHWDALKRFVCYINVFFHSPCEGADDGSCGRFADFYYRLEVARTRYWEARLDDVNAEEFQLLSHLNLFHGVELAAGHLLAVAEGGVEDIDSVVVHSVMMLIYNVLQIITKALPPWILFLRWGRVSVVAVVVGLFPPSPAYDCPPPHATSARRIIRCLLFAGLAILMLF